MRLLAHLGIATGLVLSLGSSPAMADDDAIAQGVFDKSSWPLETIHRPLTLAGGMLEARGDTFVVNLSKDNAGDPMWIAPDIYYGINGQMTAGITHSRKFGPLTQGGFCVSGDNCADKTYNSLGAEVIYALTRGGNVGFAAHGGLLVPAISQPGTDNFIAGLTAGLTTRFKGGKIAVVIDPSIYIGVLERDPAEGGLKEQLAVPLDIQYQLNPQTMVYVSSGMYGQMSEFGDNYSIPAGLGANLAINSRADVGAELEFLNVAGKETPFTGDRFDGRTFTLRLAIRI